MRSDRSPGRSPDSGNYARRGGFAREASGRLGRVLAATLSLAAFALPTMADSFGIPDDLAGHAVLSCQELSISGSSVVTSEGLLTGGAQGEQGHVLSNRGVDLNGNVTVYGDATAGPGHDVTFSGQPSTVTGTVSSAADPFDCAPIDLSVLSLDVESSNDNDSLPPTEKGNPALSGADGRSIDLKGKDALTIPAGTYLIGDLKLAGNSSLRIDGAVHLLVTGAIDVKGGSHVNLDGNPYDLRVWSTGGSVSLASHSNVFGFLYAPNAEVSLTGQSVLVGGLHGDRVDIAGGSRVRRVADDAPPDLEITAPADGDTVEVCEIPVAGFASDDEGPLTVTVNGLEAEVDADGAFGTMTSLWTDDPGLVEVIATDRAGNVTKRSVRVAIVPPTVALTNPAPGSLVGSRVIDLAGNSGTSTEVTVNGVPAEAPGDGTFRLPGFDLGPDGLVTLELHSLNCGGEATATAVLDLDTLPPTIAIDSPAGGTLFGTTPVTVTGTVSDAHLASVTVNGVTAAVEGERFVAEGLSLSEGANTLVATATDALGRSTASAPVSVELDTTAPSVTITSPAPGNLVETPSITVTGTVSDPNLAEVLVNGVVATVSGTDFSASGIGLTEGENFVVATATDATGNSADSPSVVVVLDTLPPEVTLDAAALPELTKKTAVTVTGTVSDPHLDSVTVNGVLASVDDDGYVAEDVPLEEGANALIAVAVDRLGHSAETAPAAVVRDTLLPEVAVTEPARDAELTSRMVTVRGTVSDPHLDRVTVFGVEAAVSGDTFEAVDVELPEGPSEIVAHAVDLLGHAADSEAIPVVVDSLPPVVRVNSPDNPLVASTPITVTGTAEDPHLSEVTVGDIPAILADDGAFAAEGVELVEGSNPITAVARDSFGHEATSEPVVYVLDTIPPEVAITAPLDGEVVTSLEVVVSGTVSDPNLDTVLVNDVEAEVEIPAGATEGTFLAVVPLADGANTLTVTATDLAGHATEASVTVILDSLPPVITLDQPTVAEGQCFPGGGLHTFSGGFTDSNPATGLDGQPAPVTLEVLDPAGAQRAYAGTLSTDASRWTVEGVDLGTADGIATVVVTGADSLGNLSRISASYRIDAPPPSVSLLLEGGPFPGAAPGATPAAGETPTLFGRSVTPAVRVEDGEAEAPPAAVLTLNGVSYAAGTPISAEGEYLLVATATDCAGQTSSVHALFTIDRTPPALRSSDPAAGARLTIAPTSFAGVSDPDLARATVNGSPASVSGDTFQLASFPWKEGENRVVIELEDRAGNRSTQEVLFRVRTTPLAVEILESGAPLADGTVFLRPMTPEIRPSDSTAAVTATLDGSPYVPGSEIAAEGTHTLRARATDDWDRTVTAEATFVIDLGDGPAIAVTSPADGAVLSQATTRVEGTVSGDAPTVTVNGVDAVVSGGTWVVDGLPLEADVTTDLVAVARDSRGRTATDGVTVRVATGGPQILILEPADGTTTSRTAIDVAGVVVGGRERSADGTVTVAGASVELAADGTFRALDVPLATGTNELIASVVDPQDRTGTASVTVIADFTPPAIRFRAEGEPLAEGASFSGPITLGVEVTDDLGVGPAPSIRLNGAPQTASVPLTEIPIEEGGGYVVSVSATDAAGNRARGERSFILAFGGCSLGEISPAAGSATTAASISLVGRATSAEAVRVRVPQPAGGVEEYAAQLAEGTFLAGDLPLPTVGVNALTVVCVDAAGAAHSVSHPVERLADDATLAVEITDPAAGASTSADVLGVQGTVTSGSVTVNGLTAVVSPAAGLDTFAAAAVPLVEGPNPLVARAVDAAGRTAVDRVIVDRDSQAPKVQITRPDNNSRVGVAGAGPAVIAVSGVVDLDSEPNFDRLVVSTPQGSVTAIVDPATGTFEAPGVPLDPDAGADAAQRITATATDTLGHSGSSSVEVRLDPAGPAIVLHEPDDLTRYGESAPVSIAIRGEAWGAEGTRISINGIDLDPATLAWEAAAADGRRHVTFEAAIDLPFPDGGFGVIARATDLQDRWAQDRRLLFRDQTPPTVVEMIPADGADGVERHGLLFVLFSEPVVHSTLDAGDGLNLTRESTGEVVVGSKIVAGQAVAFVPGSSLAVGESYVLRAGSGITDKAGNPLADPAQARFTVASAGIVGPPVLEPLPGVQCTDEITVTGSAAPGATLKVRDGDLVFTGFADNDGRFTVSVPVSGSGYHLLSVWAVDPVTGARSSEATAVVRIDCQAPRVQDATFDRATGVVRIVFTEAVDPATLSVGDETAAVRLLDAEVPGVYQTGVLSLPAAEVAEVQLDTSAAAWWRERPVRLRVGPPAADAEGNPMESTFETVFFPGGDDLAGAFLFGEVYDDTTGRPAGGAEVGLWLAGSAVPGAVAEGQEAVATSGGVTDGRGRFVLAGEVPSGRYVLVSEGSGTTRVYRRLALGPAAGVVPFDSRVRPLAEPAGTLDPAVGGSVSLDGLAFTVDTAALPGVDPLTVRLTPLSGQGLPDLLPLGWTPAAVGHVRLEDPAGAALPETALWTLGAAAVTIPVPAWVDAGDEIYAVAHEPATGVWRSLPVPELLAAGGEEPARVRIKIAGPGTVALVIPDGDPATRPPVLPTTSGEALQGVELPAEIPALEADLALDPPVVPPTGRSLARVVASSADGVTPWPSGLAVQAYLEERLVLTSGGEVLEAPFAVDLVLYHPELDGAEEGSAIPGAAGALEMVVSPSPRAAQVLLEVGWEDIRLFPFPEEIERTPVIGPPGGTVESTDGVILTIPEGAVATKIPAAAERLDASELAALPAVAGYDTLAAVRVDLTGATLARKGTLSVPTPDGTAAPVAGDERLLLGELVEAPVDGRGAFVRLASRTRRTGGGAGERIEASPSLEGGVPLDGIVREGVYLVLQAHQPVGFATGFVRGGNGTAVEHSRVTADGLGTADLSRLGGRYAVPVPAGTSRVLRALHPALDEAASATIPSLSSGEVVAVDLTVVPVPPRILSVSPADRATEVPVGSPVSILFDQALDAGSVSPSAIAVELVDQGDPEDGPSGIFFTGATRLAADGVRIVFEPTRPFPPGATLRARFDGGVADAAGAIYADGPRAWSFSTSAVVVAGGQVHPERFHVRLPADGVAEIYGDPGAVPSVLAGEVPWAISPEIEGPVADPLRETFQAELDGSFSGTVGHPPDFPATLGSKVWVKVFDPQGQLAAEFRIGPFETADGKGFVAPTDEAVTFVSAEGIVVDVPKGAFDEPTLVTVRNLAPSAVGVPTPTGLGLGAFVDVDFEGEANETLRLSVPAPADAATDAQVFIGRPAELPWGRRLQILSVGGVLERDGKRYLSNDPSLQPEPAGAATSPSTVGGGMEVRVGASTTGKTCRDVKQEGLSKCFLQSLLMEFTLRSQAVFYYESGVGWSTITGFAQPFPMMLGIAQEAIFNYLADSWVYLPVPHDWNGGFVLPVLSNEPLELVRRDTATGWDLARQTYDPVADDGGLIELGFLGSGDPTRPMLLDARPFQIHRFVAPEPEGSTRVALEIEAKSDSGGAVSLQGVASFPVARGATVSLFDVSPTIPVDPEAEPGPPVAAPSELVCDPAAPWSTTALPGSDQMLVVVGPGDLDPASLDRLELQFDQSLDDVTGLPASQVARLLDLGPVKNCASGSSSGYPKSIPLVVDQEDRRSRLVVIPLSSLAAGHRFRLEIEAEAIRAQTADGLPLSYWETAPTRFDFATREVPGDPVAGMPDGTPALGTTSVARDMVKFGNLLVVASETGDLVAVDVSRTSEATGLDLHAVNNKGVRSATRSLATDGHNRLFYSGRFGSIWGIKTVRLEDVREAATPCAGQPAWADGLSCFEGVVGSVRVSYALGSSSGTTASEWLALGTLPEATPMELSVLTQDEKGETLELSDFVEVYGEGVASLGGLAPDAEGIYSFDVRLQSTLARSQAGMVEPSQPPGSEPTVAVAEWRERVCEGEEDYDRYQRVTIDNLNTGQSWSVDVENPWPDGGAGTGSTVVSGVRARRGDELRVRYNLRAIGHVALLGSGITVVDLNRFYQLTQPFQTAGSGQCGRRLGKFEGQQIDYPSCAPAGIELDGIAMTPSVAVHSTTGCESGQCRGEGFIDIYSPLMRVGGLHTRSTVDAPGGTQFSDMAACIQRVGGQFVFLRDVELANDVEWVYRGVHGDVSGLFQEPSEGFEPGLARGDLLFVSLGHAGIYVFDVSGRSLLFSPVGGPALIGHLRVPGHSAFRLQVDRSRGLLFAGGTDNATGDPVIDVWDVSSVNGGPGLLLEPRPLATLNAPWSTNQLGLDTTGTGLIYTWGPEDGPLAVPFERPRFVLSGLYRPEGVTEENGISAVQRPTSRFVPLGVPAEPSLEEETAHRLENEEKATAAFKVRVALPGSLGPELTARVQSLRALPGAAVLGRGDAGPVVQPPGGPGWPENEVLVRLRRVGLGSEDGGGADLTGESGPLSTAYQLYESVESVLLLADPRARSEYRRQASADTTIADEEAQCRRCDWPGYLPDPESGSPALARVKELLAGPYLRAHLHPTTEFGSTTRQATEAAIAFFEAQGENYPLPAGWAEVAAPAAAVPSPAQVSLAEPAQSPAIWSPGEAGVSVSLVGGELLASATDHSVEGRAIPFSMSRTYRSGMLGYGPLGSAGWSASLFSHLREIPTTGEVEYHDGAGHVWRFPSRALPAAPDGYEEDDAGSYYVPKGVYLRLQKLSGGQGWRLVGRNHDVALFDGAGRLIELSDRHYRGGTAGERGSRMRLAYDPFGQLAEVIDDLGRRYRFEYHDDPRPIVQGGDGPRYGLLESITDFVGRKVEYRWDEARRLTKVLLPEVDNPVEAYGAFSFQGTSRPAVEYRYDPAKGAPSAETATAAVLHGEFAKLRLGSFLLPDFVEGVSSVPRARFEYDSATGRLAAIGFPTPENQNSGTSSVKWRIEYSSAWPAEQATVRAPWGHPVEQFLTDGRVTLRREELAVQGPGGPLLEVLTTRIAHADDGRVVEVERPDGALFASCYADGEGGAGCAGGEVEVDRLARANVIRSLATATTQAAKGSADYDTIETGASYQEDNLLTSLVDGEARPVNLAVPEASQQDTTRFAAESVAAHFAYDRFGRVEGFAGDGEDAPAVRFGYGADARNRSGAGLVQRIERGAGESLAFWQELSYDDAYNVERVETSQGTVSLSVHDGWDRVVRGVSGLSADGRFAQVGSAECAKGTGAIVERAFDAAGHVVRERRLQDYVDPTSGETHCRWVESRYRYNAREQLVSVEETHVASHQTPGQVIAQALPVMAYEYDEHGRLGRERTHAVSRPDLLTTYRYDPAGRVAGVTTGQEGEKLLGYDEVSRVVRSTDGDQGVWQGRFDAWDRLYHEELPTGAVVRRRFDRASNPLQETVFDADPTTTPDAEVLSDVRSHVTSFGAVDRVAEVLTAADGETPPEIRVTETVFDGSGRPVAVWSGPPHPEDSSRVDLSRARREVALEYEPSGGRVLAERYGGDQATPALHAVSYGYDAESAAPWPGTVTMLESVPGQAELVETFTTSYRRDAFGRPVEERRSDGSLLATVYDRTGGPIRTRTGAGTEASTSFDGRGVPVKAIRPNGRGFTLYAYDRDGALLTEETHTSGAAPWVTTYAYDATGRPASIAYADGTGESLTYYPDSTLATRETRDGLLVTYAYDTANRLETAVPTATAATSTRLDAGDRLAYDELSRPTVMERGRAGLAGYDPALAVRYPAYDLASRPVSEVVGSRNPLSWRYDTWDRPVEVTLPAGPGRNAAGAFLGFDRTFDSVDRLTDLRGLGAASLSGTTLGATWAWGGADRLYAMTTKGALATTARYGYHGGAGPQVPGFDPTEASEWKLGTLTWGSAGTTAATAAPATSWGSFGFGWRGHDGDPSDGAKIGREVLAGGAGSSDLIAGLGWAWQYDAGVRLAGAAAGAGDLEGRGPPPGAESESFRYEYGTADELERIVREAVGEIAELETGDYGRITSRDGVPFGYDGVGRRLEDDRFVYRWSWRDELLSVTVKDTWPDADGDGEPDVSPYAGHQIRYDYDAAGRLTHRWHLGILPAGEADDGLRPFIEKRAYVWEGQSLLAEAAYGNAEETLLRWRKTLVPGPSGLDDAVQVMVEIGDQPGNPFSHTTRTYTYLRDELGTVIGLVAEDEGSDPANPPVPVRYLYTPYGEAHAETGPELRRGRFDRDRGSAGGVEQTVAEGAAGGGMLLDWSIALDAATLDAGVTVERLVSGSGWVALSVAEAVVALETGGELPRVVALATNGWDAGTSYRVRIQPALEDSLGRSFGRTESLEWRVPDEAPDGSIAPVLFEKRYAVAYDSTAAAATTAGGRFPGGQSMLFQGAWTDPVTGVAHHRARWYDSRNASWLSEDPLLDVDSVNLYAFVGWGPSMARDPEGESATVVGAVAGGVWGVVQMGVATYNDVQNDEVHDWKYYGSIFAQNVIGGAEIGASIDIGLLSGGLAMSASGALGAAGFDALTFDGRPQEWKDFGKNQLQNAAAGAVLGPAMGIAARGVGSAARALTKIPGVRQGSRAVSTKVTAASKQLMPKVSSPTNWLKSGAPGSMRMRTAEGLERFAGGKLREGGALSGVARWHNRMQTKYRWTRPPWEPQGVRTQIGSTYKLTRGEEIHHWLIPANRWGRYLPNYIKNAKWNLMRMRSGAAHARVDIFRRTVGNRVSPYPLPFRPFIGMPSWMHGVLVSGLTPEGEMP